MRFIRIWERNVTCIWRELRFFVRNAFQIRPFEKESCMLRNAKRIMSTVRKIVFLYMRQVLICISCETLLGSLKSQPTKVKIPTQKGTSITIMGCINSASIIDISKRNPGVYKKRKVLGTSKTVRGGKGTNTDRILIFLKICWIKKEWKDIMLWWDNVRIHDNSRVPTFIEARGYKPWFLSPPSFIRHFSILLKSFGQR